MSIDPKTFEMLRPAGDFTSVAPSFFVMVVPAVATAIGLGPMQAVCAVAWLQVWQPAWKPGPLLDWMAHPVVLLALTALAVVEGLGDKVPRLDVRMVRSQRRMVPWLGLLLGGLIASGQPIDVMIGAAVLALLLSSFVFCCVAPARMSVLDSGMAPFVTPIASIVQTLLVFTLIMPLSQMPIMSGVLVLVVILACSFMLLLDRRPFQDCWRECFFLSPLTVKPGTLPEPPDAQTPSP